MPELSHSCSAVEELQGYQGRSPCLGKLLSQNVGLRPSVGPGPIHALAFPQDHSVGPVRHGCAKSSHKTTLARFVGAVRNFANSEVGWKAKLIFAALVALLFGANGLNVLNSYVGRNFMTAIADRDKAEFIHQAIFYIGVFAGSTVVAVVARFAEERLGLLWRESRFSEPSSSISPVEPTTAWTPRANSRTRTNGSPRTFEGSRSPRSLSS